MCCVPLITVPISASHPFVITDYIEQLISDQLLRSFIERSFIGRPISYDMLKRP